MRRDFTIVDGRANCGANIYSVDVSESGHEGERCHDVAVRDFRNAFDISVRVEEPSEEGIAAHVGSVTMGRLATCGDFGPGEFTVDASKYDDEISLRVEHTGNSAFWLEMRYVCHS